MRFNMDVWLEFRRKAKAIGNVILYSKDPETQTYKGISREELLDMLDEITLLLKASDKYLEKCILSFPNPRKKRKILCQ